MKKLFALILSCVFLAGCSRPEIEITLKNNQSVPIFNVKVAQISDEVMVQELFPHAVFEAGFEAKDQGRFNIQFFDASGKKYESTNGYYNKGLHGTVVIQIEEGYKVSWPRVELAP